MRVISGKGNKYRYPFGSLAFLHPYSLCCDTYSPVDLFTCSFVYREGSEPNHSRNITYLELRRQVCKFGNVLKSKGIKKGDRVAIYMPVTIELAIAMLACARIGAVHTVIVSIIFCRYGYQWRSCRQFGNFWFPLMSLWRTVSLRDSRATLSRNVFWTVTVGS